MADGAISMVTMIGVEEAIYMMYQWKNWRP